MTKMILDEYGNFRPFEKPKVENDVKEEKPLAKKKVSKKKKVVKKVVEADKEEQPEL